MAWKNLKQRSLADSMMIEHKALQELDAINELIDWSQLEHVLQGIHASSKGERSWPPHELKTPYRNGTTHVIFAPLDFIARLARHYTANLHSMPVG